MTSLCEPLVSYLLTDFGGSLISLSGPRLARSRAPVWPPDSSYLELAPVFGKRDSDRIHHVTSSACVAGFITCTRSSSGSSPTLYGSRARNGCGAGVHDSIGSTIESMRS